jgi:aspartate kinase
VRIISSLYLVNLKNFHFRNYIDRHKVAIVCSARSGSTKALGTTNLLLRSASEALQRRTKSCSSPGTTTPVTRGLFGAGFDGSQSPPLSPPLHRESPFGSQTSFPSLIVPKSGQALPKFNVTVDLIREQHITAARASVRDPYIMGELEEEIEKDCDWLRSFLFAAQVCFQGWIDIR